jgi:hypothetical protein
VDSSANFIVLVVIAVACSLQAAAMLVLLLEARRLAVRLDELDAKVRPHLAKLADVADEAAEITSVVARELPGVIATFESAQITVRKARDLMGTVARPLAPLARGVALWRAFKRGATIYRTAKTSLAS